MADFIYSWKSGSSYSRTSSDASLVAHELERIGMEEGINQGDVSIAPQAVVDAARDANSPLHRFFTWDDGVAAESYRRSQARGLVAAIVVSTQSDKGRPVHVRAFVTVPARHEQEDRSYQPTIQAMSEASKRELILREALDGLNYWKRQYAHLSEFAKVIMEIESIETTLGGAAKPKRKRRAA